MDSRVVGDVDTDYTGRFAVVSSEKQTSTIITQQLSSHRETKIHAAEAGEQAAKAAYLAKMGEGPFYSKKTGPATAPVIPAAPSSSAARPVGTDAVEHVRRLVLKQRRPHLGVVVELLGVLVTDIIAILQGWSSRWGGQKEFQSFLNRKDFLHEVEEALVSLVHQFFLRGSRFHHWSCLSSVSSPHLGRPTTSKALQGPRPAWCL